MMEPVQRAQNQGVQVIQRGPAGDILRLLQRNGPMSTKQLQEALGVSSPNAVREQINNLAASGLIVTTTLRQGAGRPAHMYALSDQAQALFPQGYDVLLKLLLEELEVQEGRERLETLLAGVSARLADQYAGVADHATLEQRLHALAHTSAERGIPMRVVADNDTIVLHEHSCPYWNVAQTSSDVCRIEQHMLEHVLGCNVQLTQRLVDGYTGCQFVIHPPAVKRDVESHDASAAGS